MLTTFLTRRLKWGPSSTNLKRIGIAFSSKLLIRNRRNFHLALTVLPDTLIDLMSTVILWEFELNKTMGKMLRNLVLEHIKLKEGM